jgi:hypothetical protein
MIPNQRSRLQVVVCSPCDSRMEPATMLRSRSLALLLTSAGLLCLLMAGSLWLRVPSLPADGFTWMLPSARNHGITFTLWTHDLAFSPQVTTGGLTRQTPGPLRLTVWYRHPPGGKQDRLVVIKIPAWPPALAATIMITAGLWLRPSVRRNASNHPAAAPQATRVVSELSSRRLR